MRALITRPREDAEFLTGRLKSLGIDSLIEPLIEISPRKDAALDLADVQALLFTSANGVRAFAALTARRDLKVLTVGDGSAQAARVAGFKDVTSAGGNVGALATLAADRLRPADGILLHAGGSTLAGDLQGRLEQTGFKTRLAVLYDAIPAKALSSETRMNLNLGGIDLVLFFSPRSARIFADLWRHDPAGGTLRGLDRARALCLSAAVTREIADLGWAGIETAAKPDLEAMLDLVAAEKERNETGMDEPTEKPAASSAARAAKTAGPATGAAAGAITGAASPESSSGRRGGQGLLAVFFGLIAGALAGAGMMVSAPVWQKFLPPPFQVRTPDIGASIAPLEAEIEALKTQLAARATTDALASASADARNEVTTLKNEIVRWKTELAANGTAGGSTVDLAPIEARLVVLEAKLTELAQANAASVPDVPENLAARLVMLETGAKETATRMQEMTGSDAETMLRRQRAAALVLVIGELRSSIADSDPFAPALAAVSHLASADPDLAKSLEPALAPLQPIAPLGAPTPAQLMMRFPARMIAQAAEADMAGRTLGAEAGWFQQMLNRLSELITIRPVGDIAGEGALAALARAEAKLGGGDLPAAIAELQSLSGQAADAARPWLDQAKARMTLDQASDSLMAISAQSLAPAAAPDASTLGN